MSLNKLFTIQSNFENFNYFLTYYFKFVYCFSINFIYFIRVFSVMAKHLLNPTLHLGFLANLGAPFWAFGYYPNRTSLLYFVLCIGILLIGIDT